MNDQDHTANALRQAIPSPSQAELAGSAESLTAWYLEHAARIDWADLDTPVGRIYLAAGAQGLIRIALHGDREAFLAELDGRVHLHYGGEGIRTALAALEAYFAEGHKEFDLALDLTSTTHFQRRVLETIQSIPPGQVWSYGRVAQHIGKPGAARAVGQALGANPIPIVVPCHRVVASDGGLGGYSGGLETKRFLLRHEGAR